MNDLLPPPPPAPMYQEHALKRATVPPVEAAIDAVGESVNKLEDVVDDLLQRLEPVLTPGAPQAPQPMAPVPPKAPTSPVVSSLSELRNRLDKLAGQVSIVTKRVEL